MMPDIRKSKKAIYLDYAATTPLDLRVKKAMEPYWSADFGNPSSLYGLGRKADGAISQARQSIAGILNCRPEEIVFTAGGTESVNLAIFGAAKAAQAVANSKGLRLHIVATAIEHHAVQESLKALQKDGWDTTLAAVDKDGFVKIGELKKAVRPETRLVSVMYANNEIGSIQPVAEIGKWLKHVNLERQKIGLPRVLFHTDACQAAGVLDLDVQKLGVDLLSANGSKIYGPKQIGFLYIRAGTPVGPLVYGGGQERGLRSGTENVPGIVGLAEALVIARKECSKENARLAKLRDYFIFQLLKKIPKAVLNGPDDSKDSHFKRLPNNVNVSIPGIEGEALLLYLDSYNICASTGSACASQSPDPSHVILAIGKSYECAYGSIRFTLGRPTKKNDIDYVMKVLSGIVKELQRINPSHT